VKDLRVDGYGRGNANTRFYGIGGHNAGYRVENCFVTGTRNTPLDGSQHGNGIYAYGESGEPYTVEVLNTSVQDYQKNGVTILGSNTTGLVSGCTIAGSGPLGSGLPAQNGIQLSHGATGTISGCTVRDHLYTGSGWASAGVLLWATTGAVSIDDCDLLDNLPSVFCQDANAALADVDCRHAHAAAGDGLYVVNTTTSLREEPVRPLASPVDDGDAPDKSDRGATAVSVDGSVFEGNGEAGTWGFGAYGTGGQPAGLTITNSIVTGWDYGVVGYWGGTYTSPLSIAVSGSIVADNVSAGIYNLYTAADVAAENNWWGDATGPLDESDDTSTGGLYNPDGLGNAVSDYVDYYPWSGGNIVIVPDPQEITTVDTAGEDWVTLRYLGGLSGPLYGFSLQLSLPAELDILSVERPLSGPFATAQPFQPVDQGSIWMVDAAIGGAHPGTEGPCDLARVRVKGLSCAATGATLDLEIARLRDSFNHTLTGGVSDDGLVFVDLGDPEITAASLVRTNLPDNGFVKNGDTMRLAATLTDPCGDLAGLTVTADLSELLGVGHEAEAPTGYDPDTGEAYWDFVVAGDPDGIKTVAITAVDALGNDAALDPAGSVELDNTAPAVFVTGLSAAPGHNKIDLSWTNPVGGDPDREAFGIMIRRVGWGDYPEYATAAPVYPDAATGTKVLEAGGLPDSYLDTTFPGPWSGRDIYYYQAFVFDKAYNYGPGDAGACDRATSYWLGDVDPKQDYDPGPPEVPSTIGDGFVVFSYDVTSLSGSYYAAEGPAPWNAHCDVGPTDDYSRLGIPQPDNHVDFEDLMIFAMNYGVVTPLQGAVPGVFASAVPPALQWRVTPGTGELVGRLVLANNRGMVKGAHALVRYDASQLELLGVEKGVLAQPEGVFFASVRQEGAVVLDAAQLGEDLAFAGSGELAVVRFRARGNARPVLAESAVRTVLNHAPGWQPGTAESALADGRTGAKSPEAPPEVAAPALPATIAFHGAAPNPFTGSTELSFALPRESHVSLQVYDVSGRMVRLLAADRFAAGEHRLSWDGRADSGARLGSGLYFARFHAGSAQTTTKVFLTR